MDNTFVREIAHLPLEEYILRYYLLLQESGESAVYNGDTSLSEVKLQ
jgi:hypothetical protein